MHAIHSLAVDVKIFHELLVNFSRHKYNSFIYYHNHQFQNMITYKITT